MQKIYGNELSCSGCLQEIDSSKTFVCHQNLVRMGTAKAHHQINPWSRPVNTAVNHNKCWYGSLHILYIHCLTIKYTWQYYRNKYIWEKNSQGFKVLRCRKNWSQHLTKSVLLHHIRSPFYQLHAWAPVKP
jgi:hypothetical protein